MLDYKDPLSLVSAEGCFSKIADSVTGEHSHHLFLVDKIPIFVLDSAGGERNLLSTTVLVISRVRIKIRIKGLEK